MADFLATAFFAGIAAGAASAETTASNSTEAKRPAAILKRTVLVRDVLMCIPSGGTDSAVSKRCTEHATQEELEFQFFHPGEEFPVKPLNRGR